MTNAQVFLIGCSLTALTCAGTLVYLKNSLRALLVELCGTPDRARFWLAFSNVALVLVLLIFTLSSEPEIGPGRTALFELAAEFKNALIGLLLALFGLALVLVSFIRGSRPNASGTTAR